MDKKEAHSTCSQTQYQVLKTVVERNLAKGAKSRRREGREMKAVQGLAEEIGVKEASPGQPPRNDRIPTRRDTVKPD